MKYKYHFSKDEKYLLVNYGCEGRDLIIVRTEDITERKKNEEIIKSSEVRRRKLFEESLDGICLAEAETGIIVDCNKKFVDLIGWNKSD